MKRKFSDCLSFAEGNGKCAINKVKGTDFPETLVNDPKLNKMVALRESGMTLREIASEMNFKSPKTVVDHLANYEKKKQLYENWVAFWCAIEPIKNKPFLTVAENVFSEYQLNSINRKGIETIGDYLLLSVKMSVREMQGFLGDTKADYVERRKRIFKNIAKEVNSLTIK